MDDTAFGADFQLNCGRFRRYHPAKFAPNAAIGEREGLQVETVEIR